MAGRQEPRVRRSVQDMQAEYEAGTKAPLEDLWRAWIGMASRPASDPTSFYALAGHHGAPGDYCNHQNVLFPLWHRAYMHEVEDALRSVPGCAHVTLPFWDETSSESLMKGVPWVFTRPTVELDGETIENPLRSFNFIEKLDETFDDGADYSKPVGYDTVRYPLSGLVGTALDRAETTRHNQQYADADRNVTLLNENVIAWLTADVEVFVNGQRRVSGHVKQRYEECLKAENYTAFSNLKSAQQWNFEHRPPVTSLEAPHNSIHLAVGGFELPGFDASPLAGANGDMGENDTAAYDPIFYFHHCFVDRVFWLWQREQKATQQLDIIAGYPGTEGADGQVLDLDSPLRPFTIDDGETAYTPRDCIDIETQLGYTYGPGSLDDDAGLEMLRRPAPRHARASKTVAVKGIDRAQIAGSFTISVFANIGGTSTYVGTEAVLSRWHPTTCSNCQQHLIVGAQFPLAAVDNAQMELAPQEELADTENYDVVIQTRRLPTQGGVDEEGPRGLEPQRVIEYEIEII